MRVGDFELIWLGNGRQEGGNYIISPSANGKHFPSFFLLHLDNI